MTFGVLNDRIGLWDDQWRDRPGVKFGGCYLWQTNYVSPEPRTVPCWRHTPLWKSLSQKLLLRVMMSHGEKCECISCNFLIPHALASSAGKVLEPLWWCQGLCATKPHLQPFHCSNSLSVMPFLHIVIPLCKQVCNFFFATTLQYPWRERDGRYLLQLPSQEESCTLVCSLGVVGLHSLQWLSGWLSTWSLSCLRNNNACIDTSSVCIHQ